MVVLTNVGFANLDRVANRLTNAALRALATPEPSLPPVPSGPSVELPGDTAP